MFITSREGNFLDVNKVMEDLTGYSREDLIGNSVGVIYENPEDRITYQKIIETEKVVHDYQITLKKEDGSNLFCLIDAILWETEEGPRGYYGIIRSRSEVRKSFQQYFDRLKEERRQVREERKSLISETMLLMRYGSDELLDYVENTGKNPLTSGKKRVTVLFFDIKGSTKIAEKLQPEVFTAFLSDILVDIMDLIYGNHGSVNKLLGDGLMATFGAPMETGTDPFNAVNVALKIQEYLKTYNDVRPDYLTQPIEAGIGIATGLVFAGVIGSVRREEYTVLGDTVNVAARLEKLTRSVDCQILVDEATFQEVKKDFTPRKRYKTFLKGRQEEVKIVGL